MYNNGSYYSDLEIFSKDSLATTNKFFTNLSKTRKLLDNDYEILNNFFKDFQYLYNKFQQLDCENRKLKEELKIAENTVKLLQVSEEYN